MTGQSSAAAERSFHEAPAQDGACFVCGGPWRKGKGGTSSYAARCLPPLVEVCSAECAADPKFNPKGEK